MDNIFKRKTNLTIQQQIRNKTITSFTFFFFAIICAIFFWKWLQSQPKDDGALRPLRKVFNADAKVFDKFYSIRNLAPTYSVSKAVKKVRVNGDVGLSNDGDTTDWVLQVIRKPGDTLFITLDEIKALPKSEIIFDFKCIEGWSQISHWGGVRFEDFAEKYKLCTKSGKMPDYKNNPHDLYNYAGMITPDEEYYVGLDMPAMLHPQTLLCYEMNGATLPVNQGYPLRLICPVKYGIKSLKRIGTMFFSDAPPPDYWAERGYDYYSGL